MKKGFLDQKDLFLRNFLSAEFWVPPPPKNSALEVNINCPEKLAVIWKNPDSFEIIQKIGYHLENPDSFEIIRKIGNHLEKIRTVLKPSRKLEIIWKNPDRFEFESIETV